MLTFSDPALTGMSIGHADQSRPKARPEPLTSAQRMRRFGVSCNDCLEWPAGWEPGGEYVKLLKIKNVSDKVMKLTYRLPESKSFSMAFPEPIKLMRGLSHTLRIAFRPIRLEECEDSIEFTNEKGSFVVPIRAAVPKSSSKVPTNLDFGFTPVNETVAKSFVITNDGDVPFNFSWACEMPFTLQPLTGSINPGSSSTITIQFSPTAASVYVADCICTVSGHKTHRMRVGGIGKYPFISASQETLSFGEVLNGQQATQHLKLRNTSLVNARFVIVRAVSDVEPVFTFSPTSGVIPPDGEQTVHCQYSPRVTGTFSSDAYDIRTPGGNSISIKCEGETYGPEILLSKDFFNFGDVPITVPKKQVSRVLELLNHSDLPVPYFFYGCEANGMFGVDKPSGVIPPRLSSYVNLTFCPHETGNYFRRFYILVQNQRARHIDIIGTGYTEKRRPAPLQQKHILDYFLRERMGLHKLSPEELQAHRLSVRQSSESVNDGATMLDFTSEHMLMSAMFKGSTAKDAPVALDTEYVDFGGGSRLRPGESKNVQVFNRTSGKMTVHWIVPEGYNNGSPADMNAPVFSISPLECDVLPNSAAAFRVQFRPHSDQQYYTQYLECHVSFKTMRTFRLVNDDNFATPWCLTLAACGHSFPMGVEQFIPKAILSHRQLTFPGIHVGDSGYQTISIKNDNDTPMMFSIKGDASGVFKVLPESGAVPAGGTQLLVVRFCPRETTRCSRSLQIVLNNDLSSALWLSLIGTGCKASLTMGNKGRLFFPTTCVGAISCCTMTLSNRSRLPLAFEWDVPEKNADLFRVEPAAGVLRGHQDTVVYWYFSPQEERQYLAKVPVLISAMDISDTAPSSAHDVTKQTLSISAAGSTGKIVADPKLLDYGTVLIADNHRRHITLINSSAVDLHYSLHFQLRSQDDKVRSPDPCLLTCDKLSGNVPARNTVDVQLILTPDRRERLAFDVLCSLRPGSATGLRRATTAADEDSSQIGPPFKLCEVTADADYPLLQIVDARLAGMEQEQLWRHLRLNEVNSELASTLSEAENTLKKSVSSGDISSMQKSLRSIELSLPPSLPGAADMELYLLVRNSGGLDATFQMRYPTEMELQIEHWADKGEPSAVELKQHLIIDKGILSVSPKKAHLSPGESVQLIIRMQHFRPDEYELPLMMQVASGKQLVLNLIGRTLIDGELFLHIPAREVRFGPTPIGLALPQRHAIELPNFSSVPLEYEIHTRSIEELNENNFNFPIIVCTQPKGSIAVGSKARVPFLFHPLEARDYKVAIKISTVGEGTRTMLLVARGYHPSQGRDLASEELDRLRALAPPMQLLDIPRVPLRLAFDRCLFGRVPRGATCRQVVAVKNVSDLTCRFQWDEKNPLWGDLVSVYPASAHLGPGELMLCKISLHASRIEVIEATLSCTLTPQNEENFNPSGSFASTVMGTKSLRKSVTEAQPKLRGMLALQDMEERSMRRAARQEARMFQSGMAPLADDGGTITMGTQPELFKTLPTLNTKISAAPVPRAAPPPPELVLQLGVRANILPPDVLEAAGGELDLFFVSRSIELDPNESPVLSVLAAPQQPFIFDPDASKTFEQRLAEEQCYTTEAILSQLLREAMSHADVQRALETLEPEPIPWFGQIRAAEGIHTAAPPSAAGAILVDTNTVVEPRKGEMDEDEMEAYLEAKDRALRAQHRADELERKRKLNEERQTILDLPEFQELAAYVLEGTIFNLISEAALGEFPLDTLPRQIVKSLEINEQL